MNSVLTLLTKQPDVTFEDNTIQFDESVDASIYVGDPGRGMQINQVTSIRFEDKCALIQHRPKGSSSIVLSDEICACTVRRSGEETKSRAGF